MLLPRITRPSRRSVERSISNALNAGKPERTECWAEIDVQDPFTKEWHKSECCVWNQDPLGVCKKHRAEIVGER